MTIKDNGQIELRPVYTRDLSPPSPAEYTLLILIDTHLVDPKYRHNAGLHISKEVASTMLKAKNINGKSHLKKLFQALLDKNFVVAHQYDGKKYYIFNPVYTWPRKGDAAKHLDQIAFMDDEEMIEYLSKEWLKLTAGMEVYDLNIYGKGALVTMWEVRKETSFFDKQKGTVYLGCKDTMAYHANDSGKIQLEDVCMMKPREIYELDNKEIDHLVFQNLGDYKGTVYLAYSKDELRKIIGYPVAEAEV